MLRIQISQHAHLQAKKDFAWRAYQKTGEKRILVTPHKQVASEAPTGSTPLPVSAPTTSDTLPQPTTGGK